jgi:hypothetical protein
MEPAAHGGGAGASTGGSRSGAAGATSTNSGAGAASQPPAAGEPARAGAGASAPPVSVEPATRFDAGSNPNRNKVTAADLCTRLVEINCAGEAFCCDTLTRTVDACKADLLKTCSGDLMVERIAMNPITGFDAAAAEKAYTALETKAAACDPTVAAWGGSPDGLLGILKGTVAPNASCKPADALPDTVTLAAALVSCTGANACLFADPLGDWTCSPKVAAGGVCNSDNNCHDGFFCSLPALSLTGQCTPRKAAGEACEGPTQCSTLFCKGGKCVEADRHAAYCLMN